MADGATDPTPWLTLANFTGVAEAGDQASTFALCATAGTVHTVVKALSTTGANATQQVNPPTLTVTTTPDQVDNGTAGNNGNLKPVASFPSDSSGVAAADGSTSATSWTAYGAAGIASPTDTVTAYALCSANLASPPVQVARVDVAGPDAQTGSTLTTAAATCRAGTRLIGGGYGVEETVGPTSGLEPQHGYHMRGSYPATDTTGATEVANGAVNPATWTALLQAGGQNLPAGNHMNLHGYAMCATPPAPAGPTLATQASASVPVGGQISDTATLSGGVAPTGTITFNLTGPATPRCDVAGHLHGDGVGRRQLPVRGVHRHRGRDLSMGGEL